MISESSMQALGDLALRKTKKELEKRALYPAIPVRGGAGGVGGALSDAMSRAALMGTAGLGLAGLANLASTPIGTVTNTLAKGQAFQQLMDQSDEIRSLHAENPQKVKGMFDALYQYFPAGASNPFTASSILENMAQYDRIDHKTIQDLIKMQKEYAETHRGARKEDPGIMSRMLDVMRAAF